MLCVLRSGENAGRQDADQVNGVPMDVRETEKKTATGRLTVVLLVAVALVMAVAAGLISHKVASDTMTDPIQGSWSVTFGHSAEGDGLVRGYAVGGTIDAGGTMRFAQIAGSDLVSLFGEGATWRFQREEGGQRVYEVQLASKSEFLFSVGVPASWVADKGNIAGDWSINVEGWTTPLAWHIEGSTSSGSVSCNGASGTWTRTDKDTVEFRAELNGENVAVTIRYPL